YGDLGGGVHRHGAAGEDVGRADPPSQILRTRGVAPLRLHPSLLDSRTPQRKGGWTVRSVHTLAPSSQLPASPLVSRPLYHTVTRVHSDDVDVAEPSPRCHRSDTMTPSSRGPSKAVTGGSGHLGATRAGH